MKNKIIDESIQMLKSEGLKFSIDDLAKTLQISKKTIYKLFPNKEILATEIYETYYQDANATMDKIQNTKSKRVMNAVLAIYFDSYRMVQPEIFNKYNLNDIIKARAIHGHAMLWQKLHQYLLALGMGEQRIACYKIMVEGTFAELYFHQSDMVNDVIEMVVQVL